MHHNLGNMLLSSHCIYLSDVRPSQLNDSCTKKRPTIQKRPAYPQSWYPTSATTFSLACTQLATVTRREDCKQKSEGKYNEIHLSHTPNILLDWLG